MIRRTCAASAALLLGTLVVVAPPAEPRVAKASSAGVDDTFATFTGTNYFRAADNDIFDITGNLTVSAWVRPTSLCASSECVIVTKDDNYIFAIRNGTFQYALREPSGWSWRSTGDVVPVLNQWQHVSFAIARNTSTLSMFFNGRQVYGVTNATDVPVSGNNSVQDFNIGARWSGTGGYFLGSIDEVRVYNTTRSTAAHAQADMNTWGPANQAGLVLYYDFNEGSGSAVNNRVSGAATATNLTAVNNPAWGAVRTQTQTATRVVQSFARSYLVAAGGWTVPARVTSAEVLVVAGGGGGSDLSDETAWSGGGGGAGGYRNLTSALTPGATVAVNVGGGGHRASRLHASFQRLATNGADSVFGSIQSIGGGAGGGMSNFGWQNGASGGSGGGGGTYSGTGGAGTSGQGNNGGNAWSSCCGSGGGGGAGSAGGSSTSGTGGAAGNGVSNSISGTAVFYAGGGAGHGNGAAGSAGTSGGTAVGTNGAEGRGAGGGGGKGPGGSTPATTPGHGGTGIVIVAYNVPCDLQEFAMNGGGTLIQYQVPSGFDSCTSTFTTPAGVTALDAFLVGGGGGGGGGNTNNITAGGGGGGGQAVNLRAQTVTASTDYTIVVGRGGAGGAGNAGAGTAGGNGVASTAFGSTANGGNGGTAAPASGDINSAAGDGGASGSGNSGGGNVWEGGGGGGGAGTPGVNGEDIGGTGGHGGPGGHGVLPGWLIGWCSGMFGGGGGGGTTATAVQSRVPVGGQGGGGTGANHTNLPTAGTNHCGGGGGGGGGMTVSRNGANGGSGVVYVRYNHAYSAESFSDGAELEVAQGAATNLGLGASYISDYTQGETVRARLSTTNGTISIANASGATVTNNDSALVTVVGTQTNVNAAINSATLTASTLQSTQITVDVDMNPVNQTFGGNTYTYHTNGHFYLFTNIATSGVAAANTTAVGMSLGGRQGFLATPSSQAELNVLNTLRGSANAWIGLTDDFTENTFRLIGEDAWGPVSTGNSSISGRFNSWGSGEPNNAASMEDYIVLTGSGYVDVAPDNGASGVLIEFEPKSSRRIHNVAFTGAASRAATVSSASNLGLGSAHIGASTFTSDETITATVTAPSGTILSAAGSATVSGAGTTTVTIEGTKANVNATLANVTVTAGTTGDKTITVSYRAKTADNGTSTAFKYNAATGTYYRLFTTQTNHTSARSTAESSRFGGVPGFLTTIGSLAERNFIKANVTTSAHLTGTDDLVSEGQWTSSGRDEHRTIGFDNVVLPGGYAQWNTGEPNGGVIQNCLINFWSGDLADDGTCSSNFNYVVEFRPYAVTQELTIAVNGPPTLTAPTTGLNATVGAAYSLTLSASGGVAPYTYNLQSGTLPTGLSLVSSGVISGTATESPQSQPVTIRVTDANGATATSSSFTLTTDATSCTTATTVVGGHTVHQFTTTGYCQWEVPAGVTAIDAFVVGGGGGGGTDGGEGGGGGGYHPRNGVAVTPGEILTIRVGDGGAAGIWQGDGATSGQSSSVTRGATQLLNANGGAAGISGPVGTAGAAGGTSTGGFAGGKGGSASTSNGTRGTWGAVGAVNYFLGAANEYSGGGGGGIFDSGANNLSSAMGLSGGGSGCDATSSSSNTAGFAGRVNSGGGGGGGCAGLQTNGGRGGSGVAMIRHTTDPLDAFPAHITGLQARYVADDYQTLDTARKTWVDTSNNGRSVTTVGGTPSVTEVTGNGASKTVRTVNGGINETLTFPSFNITSNNYTLFHLARYSGSTKGRIFTSTGGNWLSGFWGGVSGVAHHNAWMTSTSPSNASTSHWVLSADQNILYRANGRSVTTSTSGLSYSSPLGINIGWAGNAGTERSDWQVPEVIAYNRVLSAAEIRQVESYLARTYGLLGSDNSNNPQGVLSPRNVSAARAGTSSTGASDRLTVTWTAPTDTWGITDYKVEYKESGTTAWTEWTHTPDSSLTSAVVTGLNPGTAYDLRVTAVDSDATNRPSVTTSATTWMASSTALSSTPANPTTGTTYTLVATVTNADGTVGTVAFMEGGDIIAGCATRPVVSGLATCSWTPTTLGTKSLTATFSGDSTRLSSTTASVSSMSVTRGICTTSSGTTGRFTYMEVTSVGECLLPTLPAGVESIDALVVGAGGGGAENVGSGGSGGGGYFATNVAVDPTDEIEVTVGAGGRGGAYPTDSTTATTLRDGGDGGSTVLAWGSNTFTGGGGIGGQTHWTNNGCGVVSVRNGQVITGGSGSGSGGTAYTGGTGGQGSTGSGVAASAGGNGFLNGITGTDVRYGGAGGGGGWSVSGGAGGLGGGGAGSNGAGTAGTDGTGGGGGAGGVNCGVGGRGGNGRVIVRYANVPTISTGPSAASKTRGQSHTFSVSASATGATSGQLTYQWMKNGTAIAGATSDTYTIASLSTTDAGSYSVVVKSSAGGTAVSSRTSTAVTLAVSQATQSITFAALSARTYGDTSFSITATASSGLLVSFASSNTTVCTVGTGTVASGVTTVTVSVGDAGSCTITASQAGDAEFLAATSATRTLTVNAKTLTLSGLSTPEKEYDRNDSASVAYSGHSFGSSVVGSDVVTLDDTGASATFSDANVGSGKTITVTGLALAGADAANYALPSPITTTGTITAKAVTLTGLSAQDRDYDGGLTATITGTPGLSGVILGDTVTVAGTATGAFSTRTVGAGKTVTVSGLTLSGTHAANYSLTQFTTTAEIRTKAISLTGLSAVDRDYNAGLAATITGTPTLVGVEQNDVVTVSGTPVGAFSTKTAGAGKTVTVSGLSLSGGDAANYSLTTFTTTAEIRAKAITVTGLSAVDRDYDGGRVATIIGVPTLVGVEQGDTVTVAGTASGTFDDRFVGAGKTVTVSGLSLSGGDAANYSLTQFTTTAEIRAKAITLTGLSAVDRDYNAGLAATITGTPSLVGLVSGDAVTVAGTATGAFSTKTVGAGKTVTVSGLTLSGTHAANYSLTQFTTSAEIRTKAISLTGLSAVDRDYNAGLAATITGTPTLVGVEQGDTVTVAGTASGAFSTKTVGAGKTVTVSGLSLSGGDAANYSLTTFTTTAEITTRELRVTNVATSTKVYNASRAATVSFASATFVNLVAGDDVGLVLGNVSAEFDTRDAGTNKPVSISGVAVNGSDAGNYRLVQPASTGTILPKPLQVVGATSLDRPYDGGVAAVLNFHNPSLSGVMVNDSVSIVTSNARGVYQTPTVGVGKTVTIDRVTLTGIHAANYEVPVFTVISSVTPRELTVVGATATSRHYNGSRDATSILDLSQASLTNLISGDSVSFDTGAATGLFDTRHAGVNKTIAIANLGISGQDAFNYVLNPATVTGAITPRTLQVHGVTATGHVYDGGTDATSVMDMSQAHLVGVAHQSDDVHLASGAMSASFATPEVGAGKTVTVSGLSLTGNQAGNYVVAQPTLTVDIEEREITITGITVASREYNGTTAATALVSLASASLSNTIAGDDVTLVAANMAASFTQKTAGDNKTVNLSGFTVTGADAFNYRLRQPTATGTIMRRQVTVSGIVASDKVFDGNTSAAISTANAVVNGILGNDAAVLDVQGAVGTFANAQIGTNKTVTVAGLSLTGADAGNYAIVPPTATATIYSATTPWTEYVTDVPVVADPPAALAPAVLQLPPAPARVTTSSVSRGRATRVTAVRRARDVAIPVNRAIITVTSTSTGRVLARINVRVDPNNPTTSVTVPYVSRQVRVTVQFANDVGISAGKTRGINVSEGNTFEWSVVGGAPQVRGDMVPGTLIFARGSSTLTPAMKRTLTRMARTVQARGGLVYVTGYAQPGETRSTWLLDSLARKRAEAVSMHLSSIGVRQWITFQGQAGTRDTWNPDRQRQVVVSTQNFLG